MKHILIALFTVIVGASLTIEDAEARRLGGGGSSGIQRSAPIKRDAAPAPANPAPAAPQNAGGNRWLGPVAGIAAGLGLAALASYLGFGEEFGTMMMMVLIAFAVFFVFRLLSRRSQPQPARPMQYATTGGGAPRFEMPTMSAGTAASTVAAPPLNLPADFDADNFIRNAKLNFVRLQAANDAGDSDDIRQFTTPEMYAEIKLQIQERGAAPQKTDIVKLDAELLDFATEFGEYITSVRFFGTIRETAGGKAEAFDEVWHITKPIDGKRNWAMAGIQQSVSETTRA